MGVTSVEGFKQAGFPAPQVLTAVCSAGRHEQKTVQKSKNDTAPKAIAAALFGGGAILFYLGVKRPSYGRGIKKLFYKKNAGFADAVVKFNEDTEQIFKTHYKELTPFFAFLKNTKIFDSSPVISKMFKAKTGMEVLKSLEISDISDISKMLKAKMGAGVLKLLDESFAEIRRIKRMRASSETAHLSDMDEARQYIYSNNYGAYNNAAEHRHKVSMDMLTASFMPRFSDGKFESRLEDYEKRLANSQRAAGKKLLNIQNTVSNKYIETYAGKASVLISQARRSNLKSEQNIMLAAYTRASQIFGFDIPVQPLFICGKSFANFNKLAPRELLPKPLSKAAGKIIMEPYVKYVLEHVNFKKLSGETIKDLYNRLPDGFSIKQLDLTADRLRLQQAADYAQTGKTNSELKILTAKLEYLSLMLEDYGSNELYAKCGQNFTGITDEALKAKLYYLHNTAKRLGLCDIDDIDKYLSKNIQNYKQTSFKQIVDKVRTNPDKFYI